MKYLFLFIITLSFLIAGCSKKEEKPLANKNQFVTDTSEIKTIPVSNPNESFLLKYTFEKGKKYQYRISSISSDMETMKADSTRNQNFKQNSIYILELSPLETDQEGTIEISAVISSIKIDASMDGQKTTYESGTIKDSTDKIKYAQYEALIKNPFSIRVSKVGEILEIMRVDKIVSKFFEINPKANAMNAEQKAGLRTNFINGLLRPLFVQIFRQIPDHNIAKDSTWSITQPPTEAMVFKLESTEHL